MTTFYFSLLLVLATVFTGVVWLVDHFLFKPKREAAVKKISEKTGRELTEEEANRLAPESSLVEFSRSAFPLIVFILILRSFIYEPFRIPSGSMLPTLLVGDFILVEKFRYGLRDPIFRHEFYRTGRPQHGEIAVFKYPLEPDIDYIKRVVGLPGDRIIYQDKTLYIERACAPECRGANAEEVVKTFVNDSDFFYGRVALNRYEETLGERTYNTLINPTTASQMSGYYNQAGTRVGEWIVPEGHYFVVGDNRDNSRDSRYWGFVQEDLLVGRAVFVWLSLEFERSPDSLLPGWIPSRVRFERLGGLT
ncbi:MAG: signal peptidase I [Idiomarina sp.]|nr:signal peptidase I [Idiomarina sp.]